MTMTMFKETLGLLVQTKADAIFYGVCFATLVIGAIVIITGAIVAIKLYISMEK